MKKLLFAGMVVMGTFAFAACGGSSNTGEGAEGADAATDTSAAVMEEPAVTDTVTMGGTDTTGTGTGTGQ